MTDPWPPGGEGPPASPPPPPGYPPAPGSPGGPGGFPPPPGPGGYPPGGPGWGPPTTTPGYDGFAIAALVLGIVSCFPLGLIFGIVALSRIGRSGRKGRGLAIAGIVVSALWIVALVAALVLSDDAERDDDGTITEAGDEDVFDLREGDCFNDPPQAEELQSVSAVPCSEPHDAEVYAEFRTADDDDYPGAATLAAEAERGCFEAFEPFVGTAPESSSLSVHFLLPTEVSWDSLGDREITCIVVDPSGPTTGSLEGAAR